MWTRCSSWVQAFPAKSLLEDGFTHKLCFHSLPVYKDPAQRKRRPVQGYEEVLKIPLLFYCPLCVRLGLPLASQRGCPLEEAGLFENSVAFKWAIRAEEKIFQLIAIYPDLTGKRKIFFSYTQLQCSKTKQKTHKSSFTDRELYTWLEKFSDLLNVVYNLISLDPVPSQSSL